MPKRKPFSSFVHIPQDLAEFDWNQSDPIDVISAANSCSGGNHATRY